MTQRHSEPDADAQLLSSSAARILFARVMHRRLHPHSNYFAYRLYYWALPLSQSATLRELGKRFRLLRFDARDHGARDGSDLLAWAQGILHNHGITTANGEIILLTMPRVLGWVFNPISIWFCLDQDQHLRAVLCQVNNTFGETHTYLCAHADHRPICSGDALTAEKLFHVSPFLTREGSYVFRFLFKNDRCRIVIDLHDAQGSRLLVTSLSGAFVALNEHNLRRAFWQHPLLTLKVIALIHMQAFKLLLKGIGVVEKPPQLASRVSASSNLTKT